MNQSYFRDIGTECHRNLQASYRVCTRCVMDTSDPFIEFDEIGQCNHCTDFLSNRLKVTAHNNQGKGPTALRRVFERIAASRPHGVLYDAIVGVSGGVDSSYTVILAQEAGLRVLAVHMDNGWDTPVSVRNIRKLINLPNVGYYSVVLNWNRFKLVQRAFIEAGVPDIELPTDIAIQSAIHNVAKNFGIKTILSGGNIANEGILPATWLYNGRDTFYARSVIKSSGYPTEHYSDINMSLFDEMKFRFIHGIKTLYPLNYLNYDKSMAKSQLADRIGWQDYGGKHCESTFTRFTQLIYLPIRHKVDYRRGYLSADICLGRVTREKALGELECPPWSLVNVKQDISFVAWKLGYDEDELWRITHLPHRWYTDFPNHEKFLAFLYGTYRFFTGRKKASNF
jgi:N-acetyl sugar amidotransferase